MQNYINNVNTLSDSKIIKQKSLKFLLNEIIKLTNFLFFYCKYKSGV